MRRLMSALAAMLLAVSWLVTNPTVGRADSDDDSIRNYQVTAVVGTDGVTKVHLKVDFDFGADSGHGMFFVFPLRQAATKDHQDLWRIFDYSLGPVSSPSGANTETTTESADGTLTVRIGNENQTFRGTQVYEMDYTVRGLVEPKQEKSGLDEFNWDAVGPGWEVPIDNVSVTVTGPALPSKTACFAGGSDTCTTASQGNRITYRTTSVGNGRIVQVVAGYPVGTFIGAEPHYTKRVTLENALAVTAATGTTTVALAGLGGFFLWRRLRRSARDQVYLGLTPGVSPAPGQEASVGFDSTNAPVAVAFTPPKDARPGEIGTLIDATADERDITATLVDLAVRNHLSIEQTGKKDFTFTLKQGNDDLAGYETKLLSRLFAGSGQVTTADLRDSSYSGMLSEVRSAMYDQITTQRRWYSANPSMARGLAVFGGMILILAGAGLAWLLGQVGWGLVGLAPALVGLAVLIFNNKFGRRTAEGSAVLAQARGFELYLTTAEADQIKFEEGIDVFSRYLPYAMVFGVADRWTRVFQQLAADGRYEFAPTWYYGYGWGTGFGLNDLSGSLSSLSSSMSSSLQAATAASSGGSGFSGGGGFGGGGGGGW